MAVCRNCSTELVEGSRFCHMCGTEVVYQAFVCGDCGYPLRQGALFCGKCGSKNLQVANNNPFRQESTASTGFAGGAFTDKSDKGSISHDKHSSKKNEDSSFEAFQKKIEELEFEFIEYKGKVGEVDAKRYSSPAIDNMIKTINKFSIPEDSKQILQFIRLASVKIDDVYGGTKYERYLSKPGSYRYTDIVLSYAWLAKMEQAYQKAKIYASDGPVFQKIDKAYRDKMRKLGRTVR